MKRCNGKNNNLLNFKTRFIIILILSACTTRPVPSATSYCWMHNENKMLLILSSGGVVSVYQTIHSSIEYKYNAYTYILHKVVWTIQMGATRSQFSFVLCQCNIAEQLTHIQQTMFYYN